MDKNDTTFGKFDTSNNTQPISETSSTISVGSTGSRINMNDNFNIISILEMLLPNNKTKKYIKVWYL